MKQSSKRLVSIVGALLLVIAALVIFFDVVEPEYGSVMQVKGQVAGENALLQTESQEVATAQKIISEYQQDSASEQSVAMALPTTKDTAGALAQIYGIAQNNSLVIQDVAISPPTIQISQNVASQTTTSSTIQPIGSFSFQITAVGSYESLKNFLAGIETNIRIFDLRGISITQAATTGGVNRDFFTYTITVATYYQTNS